MKEKGMFRTKVFGGFNKKDVFEYFDSLKTQIQDENSDLIEKSSKQTEEIEKYKAKIQELEAKIKKLQDSSNDLEQENKAIKQDNLKIAKLENENSSLNDEVSKLNSQLVEENKYKSHCNELSRKIIKIESEMLIKDSKIKKLQSDYQALATKIKELPELDQNTMPNAKESLTSLAQILGGTNVLIDSVESLKKEIKED